MHSQSLAPTEHSDRYYPRVLRASAYICAESFLCDAATRKVTEVLARLRNSRCDKPLPKYPGHRNPHIWQSLHRQNAGMTNTRDGRILIANRRPVYFNLARGQIDDPYFWNSAARIRHRPRSIHLPRPSGGTRRPSTDGEAPDNGRARPIPLGPGCT